MKYVINLLKKDLKEWEFELKSDTNYKETGGPGKYLDKIIKEDKKRISELKKAIELLTKT